MDMQDQEPEKETQSVERRIILDDDWEVIDSLVEQEAAPPDSESLPRATRATIMRPKIPQVTRQIARTTSLASGAPYLLAGKDPWRKSLTISTEASAGAGFRIADSGSDALSPLTSAHYTLGSDGTLALTHTGEIWAVADAPIILSTLIVTGAPSNE